MKQKTVRKISNVHGKIKRTYLYSDKETDVELHDALGKKIKGKDLVGLGFMGTWAYFDRKLK